MRRYNEDLCTLLLMRSHEKHWSSSMLWLVGCCEHSGLSPYMSVCLLIQFASILILLQGIRRGQYDSDNFKDIDEIVRYVGVACPNRCM
jgi:hypothetical protein